MIENASCLNKSSVLFIFTLYAGTVWYALSTQAVESTFYDILCLFSLFVVTPVFIQKYYFVLNKLVNNKYLIWCVLAYFVVITYCQTHYLSNKYEIYPEFLIFSVVAISIKDTAIVVYVFAVYGLGVYLVLKNMIENKGRLEYFGFVLFVISALIVIYGNAALEVGILVLGGLSIFLTGFTARNIYHLRKGNKVGFSQMRKVCVKHLVCPLLESLVIFIATACVLIKINFLANKYETSILYLDGYDYSMCSEAKDGVYIRKNSDKCLRFDGEFSHYTLTEVPIKHN